MTTWKFPEILGGGEHEEHLRPDGSSEGAPFGSVVFHINGCVVAVARALLTEVKPALPAEPEPGAYLIGGGLAVRFPDDQDRLHRWCYNVGDPGYQEALDWQDAWHDLGGPDVTIVRLVPEPAEVELPWEGISFYQSSVEVRPPNEHREIPVVIDFRTGRGPMDLLLGADTAEAMAAALLTAARKARAS